MKQVALHFTLISILLAAVPASAQQSIPDGTVVGQRRQFKVVPDPIRVIQVVGPKHRVLFLNRNGGVYTHAEYGADDSSQNKSSIADAPSTVPAYEGTEMQWQQVMTCVRNLYAPFAIEVTDIEPAAGTDYIETVVGGSPTDVVGVSPMSAGIAPSACAPLERGINYAFSRLSSSVQDLCETIGQESAHVFGLDHEMLCDDVMGGGYYMTCSVRSFQDKDGMCGDMPIGNPNPRVCKCGGNTQNSHAILLAQLGPADDVQPSAAITMPADGAMVPPGFTMEVDADDMGNGGTAGRIDRVEFYVDDVLVGMDDTAFGVAPDLKWSLDAPSSVTLGPHALKMKAVDGDENFVELTVNVEVVAGCGDGAGDCPTGEICIEGQCKLDLGTRCEQRTDCASGICYPDGEMNVCSQDCTPGASGACPSGFDCIESDLSTPKCLRADGGGGGWCAFATGRTGRAASGLVMALWALAILAAGWRRRAK